MIAIGTKNLSKLIEEGILNLPRFLKDHPEIRYLETSLDYDNDLTLKGKIPKGVKVLSRIQCLGDLSVTVEFHRLALGIPKEQLCILLPADGDWERGKDEIDEVSKSYTLGLYDVKTPEDIERFGRRPAYASFEINPLSYPKTLIDYCKENLILTVGHGVFGGSIWSGYVRSMFPDGFLLDFARANLGITILPGDDIFFLSEACTRESLGKPQGSLYEYSKDLYKLPDLKIPPRRVHGGTTFPDHGFTYSAGLGSDTYSLKPQETLPSEEKVLWEDEDLPWDIDTGNKKLLGAYHRYHVAPWLDKEYSPLWWKKVYTQVSPDFLAIKMVPRVWYVWKEYMFWLVGGKLIKTPLARPEILMNVTKPK